MPEFSIGGPSTPAGNRSKRRTAPNDFCEPFSQVREVLPQATRPQDEVRRVMIHRAAAFAQAVHL